MKIFWKIIFLLALLAFPVQARCAVQSINVTGKLIVNIPDEAGHQTPVVEFLRRFERTFRQFAHLTATSESQELILELSPSQLPGTVNIKQDNNKWVILLPMELDTLMDAPESGRILTAAWLQTQLGYPLQTQLPPEALWIVDAIWNEFVWREHTGDAILHFTWLPGLRNLATQGYPLKIDQDTLMAPTPLRKGSAPWQLYCERARLMVELSAKLSASPSENLLKDYCFLLFGKRLAPRECFAQTFGKAAHKKLMAANNFFSSASAGASESENALETLAMRTLFTAYAPLPPQALKKRFQSICQLQYQDLQNRKLQANISDLPLLVEKFDSCASIPHNKILELNSLSALAPLQIRNDILSLSKVLSHIGIRPVPEISAEIKKLISSIEDKLNFFIKVDQELAVLEQELLPPLYRHRHWLDEQFPIPPLPCGIQSFIEKYSNY